MDGCDEEMDTLKSLGHSQIDVMKIFIPNRHSNTNPCLKIICLANQAGVSSLTNQRYEATCPLNLTLDY